MNSSWLTEIPRLFSDWLQFHYFPALLVACAALAAIVAMVDVQFVPRRMPAEPDASIEETGAKFAKPAIRIPVVLALALGLGLYSWLMLAWEDFTFYDAHIFFQSLAGGP